MPALSPRSPPTARRFGLAGLLLVALAFAGGGRAGGRTSSAVLDASQTLRLASSADESLRATLGGAGLSVEDANAAAFALADLVDPDRPPPGLELVLKVERQTDDPGLRLISLTVSRQGRELASVTRAADDSMRLNPAGGAPAMAEPTPADADEADAREAPAVLQGPMEDVLYGDPSSPADTRVIVEAARLFAGKLDLARDVELGDKVRLVFTRRMARDGHILGFGRLLYAEIDTREGPTRLYGHQRVDGGQYEFVDDAGDAQTGALLRTPLDIVRVTSGFGMRLHPLLGYTRMHEGVDFGAPAGTPVLAASDGVVEEARWAGGYGRWIRLRHSSSLETGYGHLSGWAAGLRQGEWVRQGEVIGYVGSTGLSTGPHLHFEVIDHGRPIDPKTAAEPARTRLSGADFARFEVEKQTVAALLRDASLGGAHVAYGSD